MYIHSLEVCTLAPNLKGIPLVRSSGQYGSVQHLSGLHGQLLNTGHFLLKAPDNKLGVCMQKPRASPNTADCDRLIQTEYNICHNICKICKAHDTLPVTLHSESCLNCLKTLVLVRCGHACIVHVAGGQPLLPASYWVPPAGSNITAASDKATSILMLVLQKHVSSSCPCLYLSVSAGVIESVHVSIWMYCCI